MDIDDKTRTSLKAQFAALDAAQDAIAVAMKPLRDTEHQILEARQLLKEHYEVEIADTCEGCEKLLFIGELGHRCDDGPTLCAACSPTWGDCEDQWKEVAAGEDDDPERREAFEKSFAAHIAAGGSRDDKLTYVL